MFQAFGSNSCTVLTVRVWFYSAFCYSIDFMLLLLLLLLLFCCCIRLNLTCTIGQTYLENKRFCKVLNQRNFKNFLTFLQKFLKMKI